MELIVPTSFDERLLGALPPYPVRYIYGSLPGEPSARAARWLPPVDQEQVAEHIRMARALGMGFLYTLNAGCGGNAEFTGEGQRWLVERLGWLVAAGADGLVTANPYVMAMVRRRFPELRVHVSTLANVDTVEKALFYQELGVSAIYLPEYINRDFRLLKALSRHVERDLVVVVNLGCLLHCPIRNYHANFISHASENLCYFDYSLATCIGMKAVRPVELIKAPWIRPEDLSRYEVIRIRHFKIAGREQETPWILRAVAAYSARSYPGDLNDLVTGLGSVDPFGRLPLRIHNALLEGFIEFFDKKDCRLGCGECAYCDEWARRAISADGDRRRFATRIKRVVQRFTSGSFRAPLTRP